MSKWYVYAKFEYGIPIKFKTKDIIRTLQKLVGNENLVTVAIKREGDFAWIWLDREDIQCLLNGYEVRITWTLYPTLKGVAWGTGTTSLKLLVGEK